MPVCTILLIVLIVHGLCAYNREAYTQDVRALSIELGEAGLHDMLRAFLFDQLYAEGDFTSATVDPDEWPAFTSRLSIFTSASVSFYAPSELAGPGGMRREIVRSTSRWYNSYERRDTVIVQVGDEEDVLGGMLVARVLRFISFYHEGIRYPCALVNWFIPEEERDPVTGMWVVRPEKENGRRTIGIVHLDAVWRACHLMPVFGEMLMPPRFHFSDSLSAFKAFYLNHYIDFHARECIPSE